VCINLSSIASAIVASVITSYHFAYNIPYKLYRILSKEKKLIFAL